MKTLPFKQTIEGIVWSGLYELEPYEPADGEFPAMLPISSVISLFMDDYKKDVFEVISFAIIQQIEATLDREAMPWGH